LETTHHPPQQKPPSYHHKEDDDADCVMTAWAIANRKRNAIYARRPDSRGAI